MERRNALRTVAALLAGATAACDAAPPAARQSTAPPSTPPATPPPTTAATGPSPTTVDSRSVPAGEITHGPRDRSQVALTFHGQGNATLVTEILDRLAAGRARVTVLAVGTWLAANPELGRRIVAAGHELGNHTQHHADIKQMSANRAFAEIADCAATLHRVTGSIGRWFRPSQTREATATIKSAAARAGYPTCLSYDVDSLDYTDPGPDAIVSTTLSAARPGSIISLHFGHPGTIAAMPALLAGLHRRGLAPVTMTELMA